MIVQTPTRDELQAKRDELEASYPFLKALDPSAFCCHSCAYTGVGREHGWDAADAFEELMDISYLLSGSRS